MDIPKLYEPQDAFDRWFPYWEERGYFNAEPDPDKPPFAVMMPLPNVTGALHMGHALNGTLQDLLTRWKRMQGHSSLWMAGTDHAGIATQAVVERRMLEEEGLTRHDVGREALVNRIWAWKDVYEKRIVNQQKRMGASADWRRTRFTLDDVCSKAVRRTFFKLFKDGLIYRGKRLVNWDTYLQTAVADDEVFDEEIDGHFWTFNYPVIDDKGDLTDQKVSFSTTRPETMLGDTAVCVHPSDERYTHLVGKKVRLPLSGRDIPIIADALLAKPEMGTGCVKVTPAHDPNDYACYQRNPEIGIINILNPDGTVNAEGGERYQGKDRYEARELVVEAMADLGHYEGVEDRKIPLKHSDRSKTPVEPYLSDQWFVKMDDLAQSAIDAVEDKRVRFYPSRYSKTYLDWLGEKRDWCISRQLWWGHRIPVWTKRFARDEFEEKYSDGFQFDAKFDVSGEIVTTSYPDDFADEVVVLACVDVEHEDWEQTIESLGFIQDPDVLDTWFSSALWPHETLGWPDLENNPPLNGVDSDTRKGAPGADASGSPGKNEVLDYFYPTTVLVTSRDIITLWVARMVLTGLYNLGDIPFQHVHIHPKILDGFGQTMSKSKGNGVDPMDLIDKYGADAVRFTIASFAGETQDVRLPVGYECPHCGEIIPQEVKHQKAIPAGGDKPRVECPACKKSSQYTSAWFEPDSGEPVARIISERFEYGRNFCNKLWNAARFALRNLDGYTPGKIKKTELSLEDKWILSRLSTVTEEVKTALDRYQFDTATRAIRDFTWNEFCDWYLEMIKPRLRDDDQRPVAQRMLVGVLDQLLRLLHPFTPFITEELFHHLNEIAPERGLLKPQPAEDACIIAAWPKIEEMKEWQNANLEARFDALRETIVAVRNVRGVYKIPPTAPLRLVLRCADDIAGDMRDMSDQFDNLAKAVLESAGASVERPTGSAGFTLTDAEGYIPLEGVIDVSAERDRQKKEAEKLRGHIAGTEKKLSNEKFVANAPEDVVNGVREQLAGLQKQLVATEQILADLGG
ncbi:valine--tRNA ligase [Calycomorphotria hydatis]|uniref:Valine--tRNA ligase n=1 Tax=Calycomorphotria hydatis TaxID=2528027 RepID=A0A517TC73_9PLAN|nr:valine--tRNA ligase [Calycomorphotria hydatis]QDT65963.1 Valine--tRNA ligase [Calycomorphotria hydatis]